MSIKRSGVLAVLVIILSIVFLSSLAYCQDDDTSRQVLKNGLLGAGTGAIAAGASGGNAGKGALIGAGTGVIGGILLDAITAPPASSRPPARRARAQAAQPPAYPYYDDNSDNYYYEEPPPQESGTQKVLKQGLLGAGTGAIAAGASGGNAGQGALIGAGTNVIGSALLDTITTQSQPQPRRVYRRPAPRAQQQAVAPAQNVQVQEESAGPEGGRKKIIKKYDATGKLVSEEETYY